MAERQSDGRSLRDHLESAERQFRKKPKQLENLVELPKSMKEPWEWFLRLNNHRPTGMGISAIPYSEILSFFTLLGIDPEPTDVELIELFDKIAIKIANQQQEKENQRNAAKAKTQKN